MSAGVDRDLVRRSYRRWADERQLAEDGHDAAYRGALDDLAIGIETGVRDSGAYDVVVKIEVATGLSLGVYRHAKQPDEEPRGRAVFDRLIEIAELLSLRTSPAELVIRLEPGTLPDRVDALLDLLRHALAELRADVPYR